MAPIPCKVFVYANTMHLEQVYTGLANLHHQQVIDLSVHPQPTSKSSPNHNISVTKIIVNNKGILLDVHDNFDLYTHEELLKGVSFYFKRAHKIEGYEQQEKKLGIKVFPLGLNYAVYGHQAYWLKRYAVEDGLKKKLELFCRNQPLLASLLKLNTSAAYSTEKQLVAPPDFAATPKAILMTRLWPTDNKALPQEVLQKREHLNHMRTTCIQALRKSLGSQFYGGLFRDKFSQKNYPHLLLHSNKLAAKGNYLHALREYPVCVSVNGRFSSGWSLGEYVSMSKSIVTDTVQNQLPGHFQDGQHYLGFADAQECVAHVEQLLHNQHLRQSLMLNNQAYYQNTLNPSSMLQRVIDIAFEHT